LETILLYIRREKDICGNLDSRYKLLILIFTRAGKLDPEIPLPKFCRQYEVHSS
jgi:hypothetical protein